MLCGRCNAERRAIGGGLRGGVAAAKVVGYRSKVTGPDAPRLAKWCWLFVVGGYPCNKVARQALATAPYSTPYS
jgi:hypothetical protein